MGKREHLTHSALERQNAALKREVADLTLELVEARARGDAVCPGDAELRAEIATIGRRLETEPRGICNER